MTDLATKIAQLEALRPTLGPAAVDAAIAALRAEDAAGDVQRIQATTATDNIQVNAAGDALVLREITIAAGGTLVLGGLLPDLPPTPEAIQQALAAYLRTLFDRYCFLNLQGISGDARQVRIRLRSVFVSVQTDTRLAEVGDLFADPRSTSAPPAVNRQAISPEFREALLGRPKNDDVARWLVELLSDDERQYLRVVAAQGPGQSTDEARARDLLRRLMAPRTALELIRHEPALVLLGDPGSGKTTVLRHLALGFAHARLHAGEAGLTLDRELAWDGPLPLPVLVQLRRFADELTTPPDSADPLLRHIEGLLAGDRLGALARHLQTRLEAGSVIVLLDGLDEVADERRRAWASQAAALFQSRFPRSRIVLTSRIYAYREPCLLPPPFRVATLQPLPAEAQDAFLRRWYAAALLQGSELTAAEQEPAANERSHELIKALNRRPRLREIGTNPLLLTMIALVHQHRMRLPQQRARLYEECLLLLLEQWEQRRADGPAGLAAVLGVPDQTDRLALIQPIAYQLQVCGREEATNREARSWLLERFLDLSRGDRDGALALIDRFLGFLEGRSGLLIARDIRDRYAFPHKTFQEYLVARELIRGEQMVREIVAHRHAPTWREVILLVAGHLVASGLDREARAVAWALLEADSDGSDGFYRSAVLAGELVEELGGVLGREGQALKEQVVAALVALVAGGKLAARERVEAAFLLGRLGDPRLALPEQPAYWCEATPGPFWYGDERKGALRQLRLDYGFKIARFPVTNAEYARFIADGGYEREECWTPNGWKWRLPGGHEVSWKDNSRPITGPWLQHDSRFNEPTQPVVGVSWFEAAAYARWLTRQGHAHGWLPAEDSLRLPTSLEWERAARGTDRRRYPWGDPAPTVEHVNGKESEIGRPSPVGCFPAGAAPCGAEDLLGNVREWMATPYEQPEQRNAEEDFTADAGVLQSYGDYGDPIERMSCGSRNWGLADYWYVNLGIRLVWSRALIR